MTDAARVQNLVARWKRDPVSKLLVSPQAEREGLAYSSYKALKKRLGLMCSLVELDQLSMAEFKLAAEGSGDVRRHVGLRAQAHNIHVQTSAISDMVVKMSQLHVALLHESLDWFIGEFRRESAKKAGTSWPQKKDGEDRVTHVLRALGLKEGDRRHPGAACVSLIQFFRLARNCAVHPVEDSHDYLEDATRAVQNAATAVVERYGRLPNEFEKFDLADVILYSRAIQDLSMSVCLTVRPDDETMWKSLDLKRFNGIKHERERYRNAIIGDLRTRFHLDPNEASLIFARWAG